MARRVPLPCPYPTLPRITSPCYLPTKRAALPAVLSCSPAVLSMGEACVLALIEPHPPSTCIPTYLGYCLGYWVLSSNVLHYRVISPRCLSPTGASRIATGYKSDLTSTHHAPPAPLQPACLLNPFWHCNFLISWLLQVLTSNIFFSRFWRYLPSCEYLTAPTVSFAFFLATNP